MTKPLRIVLIHGLATKPSRACLLSQWRRALLANLQLADQEAARLAAGEGVIRMAWWADAIPDHILQDEACNAGNEDRITRLIEERARLGDGITSVLVRICRPSTAAAAAICWTCLIWPVR